MTEGWSPMDKKRFAAIRAKVDERNRRTSLGLPLEDDPEMEPFGEAGSRWPNVGTTFKVYRLVQEQAVVLARNVKTNEVSGVVINDLMASDVLSDWPEDERRENFEIICELHGIDQPGDYAMKAHDRTYWIEDVTNQT